MSVERLRVRQDEIKSLADDGYTIKELNDGYCYRINGVYDLYPVNNKWHHLPTGRRGTAKNLKTFLRGSLQATQTAKEDPSEAVAANPVPQIVEPATPGNTDILTGKICWYCGNPTKLVSSTAVYERDYGRIYLCEPCNAYVGVHENTTIGKGRVANAELRQGKMDAHRKFDKIWKTKIRVENCTKKRARDFAYRWLSQQMGLAFGQCHIGWMVIEECQRVIEICDGASIDEVLNGNWQVQESKET